MEHYDTSVQLYYSHNRNHIPVSAANCHFMLTSDRHQNHLVMQKAPLIKDNSVVKVKGKGKVVPVLN
jgi:hypothetical protein